MSSNEWARFFDDEAQRYDAHAFTHNTLREVGFLIVELGLDAGAAILDIGCGTGRHAVELARRGYAVTGIDISNGMLAEARRRAASAGVQVDWRQADATRFTPDRAYDAVICLCEGAFGLLGSGDDPNEQPLAILRAAAAALKPGARCLFTMLNGLRLVRCFTPEDVASGRFDPLSMTELSECRPAGAEGPTTLRERGFVPTEILLLFNQAGLSVLGRWGGTAGNWNRGAIDLDEIEIMVLAEKPAL